MQLVLLVDDQPEWLVYLKSLLRTLPFHFVTARDGLEALKIMEKQTVSLVVTDTNMPGMDGLKLLHAVREKFPGTPVIVYFNLFKGDLSATVESVKAMGAAEVLTKEETKDRLPKLIKTFLEKSQ